MNRTITAIALLFLLFLTGGSPAFAQKKTCEELKMEIAKKIEANGVKNYKLTIIDAKDVKAGVNKAESDEIAKKLKEAGAEVEVK